ncbi:MAG: JDVT-CTERM system glutamic-type intramembrane protease [Candidatus Aenigmatarchaeota archaeon]
MSLRNHPIIVYILALALLFILGAIYYPAQRAVLPFLWIALTLFGANFKSAELVRFGVALPKLKLWLLPILLALVIFPPFTIGYFKVWGLPPALPRATELAKIFAIQLIWVAIPEEIFFRGYMQTKMYEKYPSGLKILGVKFGWAIVITAALFAIGHVVTKPHIARLAVFFPAIIFGWLREKTNSVFPAALFHALCNALTGSFEWWTT